MTVGRNTANVSAMTAKQLKEREADEAHERLRAEFWINDPYMDRFWSTRPPGDREQALARPRTLSQRELDERGIVMYDITPRTPEESVLAVLKEKALWVEQLR